MVAPGLSDSILANLVKQSLVADLQDGCSLLAVPVGLLECASDRQSLGLIFGRTTQRLQSSRIMRFGRITGNGSSAVVARQEFRDCEILVTQNQIELQEIVQLAEMASPGMVVAGLEQCRRERQRRTSITFGHPRHGVLEQNRDLFSTIA